MRDYLFRLLFPKQYAKIERLDKLLKTSDPDFRLSAPDGVCFKEILVYLVTDAQGSAIKCEWAEIPCEVMR